jgi:hypothetical protein
MTMATPVTTARISIGKSITIVEVAVATGITIIAIAVVIAMTITIATHCDTARQRQADEK